MTTAEPTRAGGHAAPDTGPCRIPDRPRPAAPTPGPARRPCAAALTPPPRALATGARRASPTSLWFFFFANSGGDLAAQDAWAEFVGRHPDSAYNLAWYGGMHPVSYSVVSPYLMSRARRPYDDDDRRDGLRRRC